MNMDTVLQIVKETDRIFFNDTLRNDISLKGAFDLVTRADIEISDFLHQRLQEVFPEVGFVSEEDAKTSEKSEYWILDPIDGTTNFTRQLGLSAVSLGFCSHGELTAGVIYVPYTKELFWAEKGKGAFLNGERIFCNRKTALSDCLGLLEFNVYFKNDAVAALEHAGKIFSNCQDIRTFGCAAISLAYVACGRADLFLGRYLKPWDYAAGLVIVSEAGGIVTNLDRDIEITRLNQHILAVCSDMYEPALSMINA